MTPSHILTKPKKSLNDKIAIKEPTKSQSLTEQLIEAIVNGKYSAGSKISETELATTFNVSRGPLREAIMKVQSLGLVEKIPHVGARVVKLTQTKLTEIYAVREALEGMAANLACQHITDKEIQTLSKLLEQHKEHIHTVDGSSYCKQQGNDDFHYLIIKASRNSKLITLLCDELYHLQRMYRYQSPQTHSRPEIALQEHQHILVAIKNRDPELAEILMRRHIKRSRILLEAQLIDISS
ncbi:MAG: GntR family transcriptional regulator [Aliivibrio sp.]|uniref:GntR family transcriptional regulator n=1 Tax=Aliivibrio sp. TaxID=1872443 RepID=UPI001A5F7C9E|nr:GntR family transcriptional regulator [Aliivibrio sp.]